MQMYLVLLVLMPVHMNSKGIFKHQTNIFVNKNDSNEFPNISNPSKKEWITDEKSNIVLIDEKSIIVKRALCSSVLECAGFIFRVGIQPRYVTSLIDVYDRIKYKELYDELDLNEVDVLKLKITNHRLIGDQDKKLDELKIQNLKQKLIEFNENKHV